MNSKLYYPLSVLYILLIAYLLVTGSEVLLKPLTSSPFIPMGSFLVWTGLVTIAYSVYRYFVKRSQHHPNLYPSVVGKYAGFFCLIMALLWGFISFKISGNWSFEFESSRLFKNWKTYTIIVASLPFAVILSTVLIKLTRKQA